MFGTHEISTPSQPLVSDRRAFIGRIAGIGAAIATGAGTRGSARAAGAAPADGAIVDVNVNLFRWPFRRLPLDETPALVTRLGELGVGEAWACSYEALLHRDLAGVNARLAAECARAGVGLVAFGAVNPALPDWEDDLRRCHETHRMKGVRLFPNYHGYTLADAPFARLLRVAAERKLAVQIAASMEDPRTQYPLMPVADVDLRPLADLVKATGATRVMLLNVGRSVPVAQLRALAETGVRFDTARVEGVGGIGAFVRGLPPGRVVFGSHAPFFNPEAAVIKVQEAKLAEAESRTVLAGNAGEFLAGR